MCLTDRDRNRDNSGRASLAKEAQLFCSTTSGVDPALLLAHSSNILALFSSPYQKHYQEPGKLCDKSEVLT